MKKNYCLVIFFVLHGFCINAMVEKKEGTRAVIGDNKVATLFDDVLQMWEISGRSRRLLFTDDLDRTYDLGNGTYFFPDGTGFKCSIYGIGEKIAPPKGTKKERENDFVATVDCPDGTITVDKKGRLQKWSKDDELLTTSPRGYDAKDIEYIEFRIDNVNIVYKPDGKFRASQEVPFR